MQLSPQQKSFFHLKLFLIPFFLFASLCVSCKAEEFIDENTFEFYESKVQSPSSPPATDLERRADLQTINNVLKQPYRPWRLCCSKDTVNVCSLWKRWYYWNIHFFSDNHHKKLNQQLVDTYKRFLIRKYFLKDEEQKVFEKFTALLQNTKETFWFSKTFPKNLIPKETPWNITKQKNDNPNILHPIQKNGKYFSHDHEDVYSYKLKDGYQFFKGLVLPSNGVNLKKVLFDPSSPPARSDQLLIHWIGHNSFLIQIDGINVLLDPVYNSFYPIWQGFFHLFKRHVPAGIAIEDLPKIDAIILSHADYDHMEEATLLYLKKYQPLIFVPEGLKKWFITREFAEDRIIELTWWEKAELFMPEKYLAINAVPAIHSSMAREELEANVALWNGYLIEGFKKNVYFPGDTAYDENILNQIKEAFQPIDIALLPIAPSDDPRIHMTIDQAIKAFDLLNASIMIPSHWGAYRTGNERLEEPYLQLKSFMKQNPRYRRRIIPLKIGGTYP